MTAAKRPDDSVNPQTCSEHSGMVTWRTGVVAILLTLLGMNGYQTFKQVPDFRLEMMASINAVNLKVKELEYRISAIEKQHEEEQP